jgi:hypothetical protein
MPVRLLPSRGYRGRSLANQAPVAVHSIGKIDQSALAMSLPGQQIIHIGILRREGGDRIKSAMPINR